MLLQTQEIIDNSLKLTPYSPLVYGFIILLLVGAIVYQTLELKRERQTKEELTIKFLDVLNKVEIRLSDQQTIIPQQTSIINILSNIRSTIDDLSHNHINIKEAITKIEMIITNANKDR